MENFYFLPKMQSFYILLAFSWCLDNILEIGNKQYKCENRILYSIFAFIYWFLINLIIYLI